MNLPRLALQRLTQACSIAPVVILMGARGVGKSTLVRDLPSVQPRHFFRLEDPEIRAVAATSPDEFLLTENEIVLDEVQRAPVLVSALARLLEDRKNRQPGSFLLTSSANLLRLKKVTETFAGHAVYTTLWPLTRRERLGFGEAGSWSDLEGTPGAEWLDLLLASSAPADDWRTLAEISGYPEIATSSESRDLSRRWCQEYVERFLDHDVPQISTIDNGAEFLRLMRVACRQIGRVVNKTEWGRESSLPPTTADRYLDILETAYQLIRVAAYDEPCRKRLITGPKGYWSDTGLAMYLSGDDSPRRAHLENMVLTDLVAWRAAHSPRSGILHWRTTTGADVSFVIEFADDTVLPVQVSAGSEPTAAELASLRIFLEEYGHLARGAVILHGGTDTRWTKDHILLAPWWRIL